LSVVPGETAETATIALPRTGRAPIPYATQARVRARSTPLLLAAIIGLSAVARFFVAWRTSAPWTFPDEIVYSDLARSFADTGHFVVRDQAWPAWTFGPLYPILLAPVYRVVTSLPQAYLVAKTINCLLFSSAAIPAYFVGRRLLERRPAIVLAALAVSIPSGHYTSKVMTESLAYPLFLWATFAILVVLERPSRKGELVALGAISVATLARGQFFVLFPAFIFAVVALAAVDSRDRRTGTNGPFRTTLSAYPLTWLALAATVIAFGLLRVLHLTLTAVAGGHSEAFRKVSMGRVAHSFMLHLAEIDLYVGILPFATLLLVSGVALRLGARREVRAVCAFSISVMCWLAAASARYLVGVDAPSVLSVYDRYEFYVAPLLLAVFLFWLKSGHERPQAAAWVVVPAAGLPLIIPYSHVLYAWTISSGAVAQLPWLAVREIAGTPLAVYPFLAAMGGLLACLFIRSRDMGLLLFVVVANLVVLNAFTLLSSSIVTPAVLHAGVGVGVDRSWIDNATRGHGTVAALWSGLDRRGSSRWYSIWESEFFNRNVHAVYNLREPLNYHLPAHELSREGAALVLRDGRRFRAEYVLTDLRTPVNGERVAVNRPVGLALYRVGGLVRLRHP
jgi:hypothetical protein